MPMKKKLVQKRQPSIDFDFCNISSSCDVVYKGLRYDNVSLCPLVLGEGYDSVPFNVMEQIKMFVP
jgi:hypothetical protein